MKIVGIVSNDLMTKNRIIEELGKKKIEAVALHSTINFDPETFDLVLVDLNSPQAFVVLARHASKCIAFGGANDLQNFKKAKSLGCDKIYKNGEFFKKILPGFKLN